jgi:hypothetical protein
MRIFLSRVDFCAAKIHPRLHLEQSATMWNTCTMLHNETINFAWESTEFQFKKNSKQWYLMVGITGVVLIVVSILLQNYLFSFLILLGTLMMLVMSSQKPMNFPIEVSAHGIKIAEKMYPYAEIEAFWIAQNKQGIVNLILLTNERITPLMSLIIPEDVEFDILDLRDFLGEFIDEREMTESVSQRLMDKIGF